MKVSQVNKDGLKDLEQLMQTSFPAVNPRPEFVHQLHQRLTDPLLPTKSNFSILVVDRCWCYQRCNLYLDCKPIGQGFD